MASPRAPSVDAEEAPARRLRRVGAILTAAGFLTIGVDLGLAFVSSPTPVPFLRDYPYLEGPALDALIFAMLGAGAALGIGLPLATARWNAGLWAGAVVLFVGLAAFLGTLAAVGPMSTEGMPVYIQPYPQSALAVPLGLGAFGFGFLTRRNLIGASRRPPPRPPPDARVPSPARPP